MLYEEALNRELLLIEKIRNLKKIILKYIHT